MLTVLLNPKKIDEKLDPISIPFTNDFYLLENLTTRLLTLDEKGNYELELASSFEKVSDIEFLIKIKDSSFSNGEKISLEDVKFSLLRTLRTGSSHVNSLDLVNDVVIEHNSRLRIKLNKPSKSFLYYLSLPDLGILHKSQYSKATLSASDFTKNTSGPFSYKKDGDDFYLVKNKFFKLTTNNYPDKIKLLNYFRSTPHELLLSGEADLGKLSVGFYVNNRDKFMSRANLKVLGVPSSSLTYLFFNENSKGFKDSKQRNWLKSIIYKYFNIPQDLHWLARSTKQYFPPESKAFLNQEEVRTQLEKFNNLQKPSSFPEEVVIHTYTTAYNVTVQKLIEQLEAIPEVKIKIIRDIDPNNFGTSFEEGKFDIFLNIMSTDFRTPVEAINYEFFSKEGALKDKDDIVKKNYQNYQQTTDSLEEEKFLKNINSFLVSSDQLIPLFHSAIPYVYNSEKVDLRGLNHLFIFNFWKLSIF